MEGKVLSVFESQPQLLSIFPNQLTTLVDSALRTFQFQASLFSGSRVVSGDYYFSISGDNMWQIQRIDSSIRIDAGKYSSSKVFNFNYV